MKNLILFLFTILLSSCINEKVNSGFGFQKRKHREGWSIDLLQKNNQNFTKIEKQNDQTSKSEVNKIENQFIYNLDNTYSEKSIEIQSYFDDKCDTIITKDGLIIYAIISSYNDYEIKYKLCEDINATNIIKSTAFIEKIKLKNGKTIEYNENKIDENRIETYAKQEEKEIKKKYGNSSNEAKQASTLALLAFLLGFLGIILGPIAFLKGKKALKRIKNGELDESNYKDAYIGIILGGLIGIAYFILGIYLFSLYVL